VVGIEAKIKKLNFRGEWLGSLVIHTKDGKTFSIPKEYWDRFWSMFLAVVA
jgi:hypothetical protein